MSFTTVLSGSCLAPNTPHASNLPAPPNGMMDSLGLSHFHRRPTPLHQQSITAREQQSNRAREQQSKRATEQESNRAREQCSNAAMQQCSMTGLSARPKGQCAHCRLPCSLVSQRRTVKGDRDMGRCERRCERHSQGRHATTAAEGRDNGAAKGVHTSVYIVIHTCMYATQRGWRVCS